MRPPRSVIFRVFCCLLTFVIVLMAARTFQSGSLKPVDETSESSETLMRLEQASPVAEQGEQPQPSQLTGPPSNFTSQEPATNFRPEEGTEDPATSSAFTAVPPAERSLSDILSQPGNDLSDPGTRARLVEEMRTIEKERKAAAWARAKQEGLQTRITRPDGTIQELVAFDGDRPIYFTTYNKNAAISTGADQLLELPYSVNSSNLTIGVWDGGAVRPTHQEFGGRVTVKDGAAAAEHSTHVGGTIAASGIVSLARGMAPSAHIDSYEWNSDKSEMTSRGASYPGEPGTIYLSNHSYGYIAGWNYTGLSSPKWDWWGSGTTANGIEDDFGKYSSYSRDSDSLAVALPYFLVFRAAGNDRGDNPSAGEPVALSAGGTTAVSYDPAVHPPVDSAYKSGGYDTIAFDAVAKNVITIGGVNDAVSGGVRQPSNGTMTSFSSWGPTDDGRIKPDIVAIASQKNKARGSGRSEAWKKLRRRS